MNKKPKVILIHGILNLKYWMALMARYLKKKNFEVVLFGYPSTKYKVSDLVEWMHPKIKSLNTDPSQPIHFVCHSMGGVLLRAYLEKYPLPNLNKVVFLGTPSQGSELADWLHLRLNKIYRFLFGPAGFQLQTTQTPQLFNRPVDFELGVIMGNKPDIKLGCFKGENDGMVSVESSKVVGMKDHILLPVSHTQMLISKTAFFQIDYFLKNGFFYRA
jgi:triacylglycerol esterase/lipase EstA (alpha/beta hydrolase family)